MVNLQGKGCREGGNNMVETRQSKTKKAKNLQANNRSKPHRLKSGEAINKIRSISLRLLKPNLIFIEELQKEKNVSFNFLLNEIIMNLKTNKRRSHLNESLNF